MATCALSLGLAYVKLDRFGFRNFVRGRAQQKLAKFKDSKESLEQLEKLKSRKLLIKLELLANLPESREGVQQRKLPGAWAFFYARVYARRRDRFIAWAGIAIAFAVLVLGRLHAVGIGFLGERLSSSSVSFWGVVVLSLFILFLIIVAWIGDFVKSSALETIDSHAAELRGFINVIVSESSLASSDNTDPKPNWNNR